MSNPTVDKLILATRKVALPDNSAATEQGRRIFLQAIDRVDDYKGDLRELAGVLRLLQTADSKPYVFAGLAYTLIAGSKERGDQYDADGLDAAMGWLESAQALDPDIFEVNCIESLVYTYGDRLDDARLILDYLGNIEPNNYYLHAAEVAYWLMLKDEAQILNWVEKSGRSAEFVPQKLRLRAKLADFYLGEKEYDKAIKVIKEAIHFDKQNGDLWGKLAVAYFRTGDMDEAERANNQLLRIDPNNSTGQRVKQAIDEKKKENSGGLGRFFGR